MTWVYMDLGNIAVCLSQAELNQLTLKSCPYRLGFAIGLPIPVTRGDVDECGRCGKSSLFLTLNLSCMMEGVRCPRVRGKEQTQPVWPGGPLEAGMSHRAHMHMVFVLLCCICALQERGALCQA